MRWVLLLLLAGCTVIPIFEDAPSTRAFQKRVVVESIIDSDENVLAICKHKNREAGYKVFRTQGRNGCSFIENGRVVILWTDPGSFGNVLGLSIPGHELYHHHGKEHF